MDLTTFAWLRSSGGEALLTELAAQPLIDDELLPTLTRLREKYSPEQARAAVELTLLRRRARRKFRQADQLYFVREALEQASSEPVATYRAGLFAAYAHIIDACCGIGGDMLALAGSGGPERQVFAIDQDGLRLALAEANAEVLGLTQRATFLLADLHTLVLPATDAIFCDPARRRWGRRRFSLADHAPALDVVLGWQPQVAPLAVKLSPGVNLDELTQVGALAAGLPYELEFISLDGELKEALLKCGPLITCERRATVLMTTFDVPYTAQTVTLTDADAGAMPPLSEPLQILYEPDPAVIRAGLVVQLAARLGAAQLDRSIAYLTAVDWQATPFARAWRILEWQPFQLKRLRARVRELDAGAVTVKKRGSPLDTNEMARQLSGQGTRPLVVVLTQIMGRPVALICEQF